MEEVVQKLRDAVATLDPFLDRDKFWEAHEILNRLLTTRDEKELNYFMDLAKSFRPKYRNGQRNFDYVEEVRFPFPADSYMCNDTSIIGVSDSEFIHYDIETGAIKLVKHEEFDVPDPVYCDNKTCWMITDTEVVRCDIHSGETLERKPLPKSRFAGTVGDKVIFSNSKFSCATDSEAFSQLEILEKIGSPDRVQSICKNLFFTLPSDTAGSECKLGQIYPDGSVFIFANPFPRENHRLLICGDDLVLLHSDRIFLL
jgi:hypothetical protein